MPTETHVSLQAYQEPVEELGDSLTIERLPVELASELAGWLEERGWYPMLRPVATKQ